MASDIDIYKTQNFGNRLGFGEKAALLIVDFVNGFTDPAKFGGGNIGDAIDATAGLLAFCRARALPVAHTRVVFADDGADTNIMCLKVPALTGLVEDAPESQIVAALEPRPGEIVVRKRVPSAFFGTDLAPAFARLRVDTVMVAGCTTSGCVRASVLDAMCHGFRPVVVSDCVGDRALGPHEANLFDMGQKYADIVTGAEAIAALSGAAAAQAAE
jgi:maleamate amidohydrolase